MHSYSIVIKQNEYEDMRDAIRNNCNRECILKWAFVLQDKEYYNEHDMAVLRLDCQKNWADGFEGMEAYSSVDEYVTKSMEGPPFLGDKRDSLWRIVIITDKGYLNEEVGRWFGVPSHSVMLMTNSIAIADALKRLRQDSIRSGHVYSDSEIEANYDWCDFIDTVKKNEKWLRIRNNIDPAMIICLIFPMFFIALAVKLGLSLSRQHSWMVSGIIGAIGVLWILLNLNAIRLSKKNNRHISGIPFIGGAHLLIAGLVSPCKWLALLCVLDYSIWSFIYSMFIHGTVIDKL